MITGFAGSYVNAGVGALVENKSLEEYGRSQGYKTLKDYHGKLLKDAFIGAAIAGTTAVVATAVLYGSSLIGNSVSDDVAKAVANQSDEAIVSVAQKTDDLAQMSDELTVVVDKVDEAIEQTVKTTQQGIASESGNSSNRYIPMDADGNPIPLRKQIVNGQDIPLPDPNANGSHTVLGGQYSSNTGEVYMQSATFPESTWPAANGQNVPWSEVHWTNHGTPHHHTNPHQHVFEYIPDKGGWIRKGPSPYYPYGE